MLGFYLAANRLVTSTRRPLASTVRHISLHRPARHLTETCCWLSTDSRHTRPINQSSNPRSISLFGHQQPVRSILRLCAKPLRRPDRRGGSSGRFPKTLPITDPSDARQRSFGLPVLSCLYEWHGIARARWLLNRLSLVEASSK